MDHRQRVEKERVQVNAGASAFGETPLRFFPEIDPYPSPEGEGNKCPLLVGEGEGEVAFVVAQFIGHS